MKFIVKSSNPEVAYCVCLDKCDKNCGSHEIFCRTDFCTVVEV